MLQEQLFQGNTAFSAISSAATLLASPCLWCKTRVQAEGICMVREERGGPGVRCLVARARGTPHCAPCPRLPTPSFVLQGWSGQRRHTLGFMSLTKPMLHCPTSPFSRPFPVAHVSAREELQSEGLPGMQQQILALWAGGVPLLPFQREIEKTLRDQHSLSWLSRWGHCYGANPRKKRGQSPWPHLELAARHGGRQPASREAACQCHPLLPMLLMGRGGAGIVSLLAPLA